MCGNVSLRIVFNGACASGVPSVRNKQSPMKSMSLGDAIFKMRPPMIASWKMTGCCPYELTTFDNEFSLHHSPKNKLSIWALGGT